MWCLQFPLAPISHRTYISSWQNLNPENSILDWSQITFMTTSSGHSVMSNNPVIFSQTPISTLQDDNLIPFYPTALPSFLLQTASLILIFLRKQNQTRTTSSSQFQIYLCLYPYIQCSLLVGWAALFLPRASLSTHALHFTPSFFLNNFASTSIPFVSSTIFPSNEPSLQHTNISI